MTGRILGHVCVRNEAERYLTQTLAWHAQICDEIHVFDDRSTDNSAELASNAGAIVDVRSERQPSFLQHEGEFRQVAWRAFERALYPRTGDWVLTFDADEFLVAADDRNERAVLDQLVDMARLDQVNAWKLTVDEIYDAKEHRRRTDGFWGDITAVRFIQYRGLGHFANRKMGCGSVPTYAVQDPGDARRFPLSILHYGYATDDDRFAKYERYTGVLNNGHNPNHIKSILTTPTLAPLGHARRPEL